MPRPDNPGDKLNEGVHREYSALAPEYNRRWSRYIEANVRETLKRLPALAEKPRILDVGCGTGVLLAALAERWPHASLAGVDPTGEMLAVAGQRLPLSTNLQQAPAETLPFPDDSFDLVISTSVFHYVGEPEKALLEMHRVLRPGGQVVITDWCRDYLSIRLLGLWLRLTRKPFHHIYRSSELAALLRESGFREAQSERYKTSPLWGMMTLTATTPGKH